MQSLKCVSGPNGTFGNILLTWKNNSKLFLNISVKYKRKCFSEGTPSVDYRNVDDEELYFIFFFFNFIVGCCLHTGIHTQSIFHFIFSKNYNLKSITSSVINCKIYFRIKVAMIFQPFWRKTQDCRRCWIWWQKLD